MNDWMSCAFCIPPANTIVPVVRLDSRGIEYETTGFIDGRGQWRYEIDGMPMCNAPLKWRQFEWKRDGR